MKSSHRSWNRLRLLLLSEFFPDKQISYRESAVERERMRKEESESMRKEVECKVFVVKSVKKQELALDPLEEGIFNISLPLLHVSKVHCIGLRLRS